MLPFCSSRFTQTALLAAALAVLILPASGLAAVRTATVDYRDGDLVMEGFVAYDEARKGPLPAVLVVHEWYGLNDFARERARLLAEMGYLAFAADIYGKGVRASSDQEAARLAGAFKSDRDLMRARIRAALDAVRRHERCDAERVAAIGFCFGGTTVLELARSGAELGGVVSFHGGLDTPQPAPAGAVKAKILILHGAADPWVPADHVADFQREFDAAGADWQLIAFGGAVHSFTNPAAGDDPSRGAAYDARAAARSWAAMKLFLAEVLGR